MAKKSAKYFIAMVPDGEIQSEATALKLEFQRQFNLKYALKSPAHITLKMPFSWNEKKEGILIHKLMGFFKNFQPLELNLHGIGRFGKRVIFIKVNKTDSLLSLQTALSEFCKTKLNQETELSDFAYHPHMTIAFKDIKEKRFEKYWDFAQTINFEKTYEAKQVALLKKIDWKWEVIQQFGLWI